MGWALAIIYCSVLYFNRVYLEYVTPNFPVASAQEQEPLDLIFSLVHILSEGSCRAVGSLAIHDRLCGGYYWLPLGALCGTPKNIWSWSRTLLPSCLHRSTPPDYLGSCGFVTQRLEEIWITECQGKDLISCYSVLSLKPHRGSFLKIQTIFLKKP